LEQNQNKPARTPGKAFCMAFFLVGGGDFFAGAFGVRECGQRKRDCPKAISFVVD